MRRNFATLDRDILQAHGRIIQEAFAHGIENDMIFGGLVTGQTALQGMHAESIIKNCILGTRRITWDGKVHVYGRAKEAQLSCFGSMNSSVCPMHYAAAASGCAVGGTTITVTLANRTVDDLVGGQIIMHPADWGNTMRRRITGNTATVGGIVHVTFEGGLSHVMVITSDEVTIYENIYKALSQINDPYCSIVGVPNRSTQALYYMWNQTWGPCFVTWSDATGTAVGQKRTVVWGGDGSLNYSDHADNRDMQHAGFLLNKAKVSDKAFEGPEIFLQISP